MPRLTTSTTAPSCQHGITAHRRSYWVRTDSCFAKRKIIKFSGFATWFLFLILSAKMSRLVFAVSPQNWVGAIRVMCGASAASCLNTTSASPCFRCTFELPLVYFFPFSATGAQQFAHILKLTVVRLVWFRLMTTESIWP